MYPAGTVSGDHQGHAYSSPDRLYSTFQRCHKFREPHPERLAEFAQFDDVDAPLGLQGEATPKMSADVVASVE